jgi:hypothetical protein
MAPVYIGAAVAGVGFLGAIVFAIFRADAASKADEVEQQIRTTATQRGFEPKGVCNNPAAIPTFSGACNTLRDNNSKVDTDNALAIVSAVIGGVGAVTAIGWYLFAPKRDDASTSTSTARPAFAPYVGAQGGGVSLSGSF